MWDFQEELIEKFHEHRFNIAKLPRQTGKSTTCVSYLLHYALFNDNVNIGILANKLSTARDLLGRLQLAYEQLPLWLQQGIVVYNKGSMELENGSKILAASTSASAVRGMSFNIIFLDEFAFVPNHIAEAFFSSVYPTITSGTKTKVIIISTPYGMNHFYKLWVDAQKNRNGYAWTEVHWSKVPGRDAKWKETTIANTSERQFTQEFECEFLGSVDTLISAAKLRTLVYDDVLTTNGSLDVYENPVHDHDYIVCVDVSRGLAQDYSAFIVIDITHAPWRLVAKYRDKNVRPMLFPNVIYNVATNYNNAHVLIEVNDIGEAVASSLFYDIEYENVLMCAMRGRAGQVVGQGFSGNKTQMGVKMSKTVKAQGCSNLKTLIEDDKLLVRDYNIVAELTTFIQNKQSFEADEGYHDDLVMCLVIFSWLVQQEYFKEMTDQDIRRKIYDEQKNAIEQDMAPFGFIDDGLEDDKIVDNEGNVWTIDMNNQDEDDWEKFKVDEYGDKAFMWDYR
tara:strand:- start:999 stop:2519 length:1521 start_codon:yes stop_codon:yes gene_type:complete